MDERFPTSFISRVIDVVPADAEDAFDRFLGESILRNADGPVPRRSGGLVLIDRRTRSARCTLRDRRGRRVATVSLEISPWCCHRSELGMRLERMAVLGLVSSRPAVGYAQAGADAMDRVATEVLGWASAIGRAAAVSGTVADDELLRAGSILRPVEVGSGTVLMHEGAAGDDLVIITEGLARITRGTDEGETELAILGRGGVAGELALLHGRHRSATVTAMTGLRVFVCDREAFARLRVVAPSAAAKISALASHRLERNAALG